MKVLLRADLCSTLFGGRYNMEHQKRASVKLLYSVSWETFYGNVADTVGIYFVLNILAVSMCDR